MSEKFDKYIVLQKRLEKIAVDSEEADDILFAMDKLWWMLTREERQALKDVPNSGTRNEP